MEALKHNTILERLIKFLKEICGQMILPQFKGYINIQLKSFGLP